MFVGVCGYGATGSSAVVGLLKEYPELMVCDKAEIQEAFKVDGLQDLEYHLVKQYSRHISGDAAIVRFKKAITYYKTPVVKKTIPPQMYIEAANKFVDSLIQGSWYGIDNIDYNTGHPLLNFIILLYKKLVFPNYEKLTGHSFDYWPARKMYLSINPEDFYEKAKSYTDELIRASGANPEQTVVFDQVFEGNAPQNCFPFLETQRQSLWIVILEIYGLYQNMHEMPKAKDVLCLGRMSRCLWNIISVSGRVRNEKIPIRYCLFDLRTQFTTMMKQ